MPSLAARAQVGAHWSFVSNALPRRVYLRERIAGELGRLESALLADNATAGELDRYGGTADVQSLGAKFGVKALEGFLCPTLAAAFLRLQDARARCAVAARHVSA